MRKILDFLVQEITLKDYTIKLWILLLIAVALCFLLIFIICSSVNARKEKAKQKQLQLEATQCLASDDATAQCLDIETEDETPPLRQGQEDLTLVKQPQKTPEVEPEEDSIEPQKAQSGPAGRFEIVLKTDGYRYLLLSSDNQLLYESVSYTTANGATRGIDTFNSAVQKGGFVIDKDELGRYRFSLRRRYIGEYCQSEEQCQQIIKLTENLSQRAVTIPYKKDDDLEKAYANSGFKKKIDLLEWEDIASEQGDISPSGKFEIAKSSSGHYFYLVSDNGEYLYFGMPYASVATVKDNIILFKRAVYSGLFGIEKDSNNRFRFVLKAGNNSYLGEYFDSQKECQDNIDKIKQFAKSAVLPN